MRITKIRFLTINNRKLLFVVTQSLISTWNRLAEMQKLIYGVILVWGRQLHVKERSCFHTKLLLTIVFDTTCELQVTFSWRWHQSFNHSIFDRLLPSCSGILHMITPPVTQQDVDSQKKQKEDKKPPSLWCISTFPHSPHHIQTIYWQEIQGACSLWNLAFECSTCLVWAFHWDST